MFFDSFGERAKETKTHNFEVERGLGGELPLGIYLPIPKFHEGDYRKNMKNDKLLAVGGGRVN